MEQVHVIGIDLAKQAFQFHGARADGSVAFCKKLTKRLLENRIRLGPGSGGVELLDIDHRER